MITIETNNAFSKFNLGDEDVHLVDVLIPWLSGTVVGRLKIALPKSTHDLTLIGLDKVSSDAYGLVVLSKCCNTIVDVFTGWNEAKNEP